MNKYLFPAAVAAVVVVLMVVIGQHLPKSISIYFPDSNATGNGN